MRRYAYAACYAIILYILHYAAITRHVRSSSDDRHHRLSTLSFILHHVIYATRYIDAIYAYAVACRHAMRAAIYVVAAIMLSA